MWWPVYSTLFRGAYAAEEFRDLINFRPYKIEIVAFVDTDDYLNSVNYLYGSKSFTRWVAIPEANSSLQSRNFLTFI